jgi:N-methylhydantoinase B
MSPIDLEIYWNRLIAITDEAGATLKRTSFSTVVRESNDFACVLLDPEARLVAQSALSIPGFIGTAPLSLKEILKVFPQESLKPGDILFTNDPWIGTGHLPDATMVAPIFFGDRLVAFAMAVAHLSDVGGRQWSADAGEVYEEGIRFPVIKLAEAGVFNPWVMQMLEANVRLPQQVRGDIEAQVGALRVIGDDRAARLQAHGEDGSMDGGGQSCGWRYRQRPRAARQSRVDTGPGLPAGPVRSADPRSPAGRSPCSPWCPSP